MNKYWSNFAKYGSPTGNGFDSSLPDWPAYDTSSKRTQILSLEIDSVSNYKFEICDFWSSLYPKGIPYLGVSDEMVHESWESYLLNEIGFFILKNYKPVGFAIILLILICTISLCCCCKRKKSKGKKKVE